MIASSLLKSHKHINKCKSYIPKLIRNEVSNIYKNSEQNDSVQYSKTVDKSKKQRKV